MLSVRFDNLEEVKKAYDPIVVEKAAYSAVKKLHSKAATRVSKGIRQDYAVKAGQIAAALKKRVRKENGIPSGFLIYTGRRLSLRHFAVGGPTPRKSNRPRIRTARGLRYGAKVRVMKKRPARVVPRAFWGSARAGAQDGAGEAQIFQRVSAGRYPLRKMTGPSIAHMARGRAGIDEVNKMMAQDANRTLSHELDHFLQRQIGLR